MSTFSKDHPDYARIESQIERFKAQRALIVGEAIGTGLIAVGAFVKRAFESAQLPARSSRSDRKPA